MGRFDVEVTVNGGGPSSQAQAIAFAVARAMQAFEPSLTPALESVGLMTVDPRRRERKKAGRAGARAKFPWSKR